MVANKAGSARFPGRFRLNLVGHGKPARARSTAAGALGGSRIMQFHAIKAGAARQRTACAIVGIHENGVLSEAARRVDRASGGAITRVLKRGDFSGKGTETFPIVGIRRGPAERILLVGLGPKLGFRAQALPARGLRRDAVAREGRRDERHVLARGRRRSGPRRLLRRAPRRREREQRPLSHSRPQDREEAPAAEALALRHRRAGRRPRRRGARRQGRRSASPPASRS